MKRLLVPLAAALLAGTGSLATAASAAAPSSSSGASHYALHAKGLTAPKEHETLHNGKAGKTRPRRTNNLTYHNGPVMHTNTVYAIYMSPSGYSMPTSYSGLITQFFGDVAADSGKSTNVYFSDTQYYDNTTGNILYSSALGGTWTDTANLPASGCSDRYTSVCLSDAQIQAEVQKAMTANGWTGGASHLFFVFTPKGVGSCAGSSCAFSNYCAYHSWIGSGSAATMYANMPYADTVPSACDAGYHPNSNDADATINVTSHEHNEAITDPQGSAWYDGTGAENGDKCAWNFGSVSSDGGNQTINGHRYILQQEWSNATSKCVLQGT